LGIEVGLAQHVVNELPETFLAKLHGRNVHGDGEGRNSVLLPPPHLQASGTEDPLPNRNNQAAVFGDAYEFIGRDESQFRVTPAQQRLKARDLAGAKVGLRLVHEEEFVAVERDAQALLQHGALDDLSVHGFGEEAKAVAAAFLGAVHGRVSILDEGFCVVPMLGEDADADAATDPKRTILNPEFGRHSVHDPFGGGGRSFDVGNGTQHDQEFVSSDARHRILIADLPLQPFGTLLEEKIPDRVPERIVDDLEAVEIEEEDRDQLAAAASGGDGLHQPILEQAAVGQSGKPVVVGEKLDLLLGAFAFGDIEDAARHGIDNAGWVTLRLTASQDPPGVAVRMDSLQFNFVRNAGGQGFVKFDVEPLPALGRKDFFLLGKARWRQGRIEAEHPVQLFGPGDVSGLGVKGPAAQPGDALRLVQTSFAPAQLLFRALAFADHGAQAESGRAESDHGELQSRQRSMGRLGEPGRQGEADVDGKHSEHRSRQTPPDRDPDDRNKQKIERLIRDGRRAAEDEPDGEHDRRVLCPDLEDFRSRKPRGQSRQQRRSRFGFQPAVNLRRHIDEEKRSAGEDGDGVAGPPVDDGSRHVGTVNQSVTQESQHAGDGGEDFGHQENQEESSGVAQTAEGKVNAPSLAEQDRPTEIADIECEDPGNSAPRKKGTVVVHERSD
jgi:hypothetical protein